MNNREKHEELAVIDSEVRFGMRDAPWPVMWFSVATLDYGALQILDYQTAIDLIKKHNIKDITDLKGAPCIVEVKGLAGGTCKFKDLKK